MAEAPPIVLMLGLMLLLGLVVLGVVALGDVVPGMPGMPVVVVSRRVESVLGISGLVVLGDVVVGLVVVGLVVVGLVVVGLVVVGLVVVGLVVVERGRLGAVLGTSLVTRPPPMTSPPALPLVRGVRVVSRVVGC
jgi:hypothetical protein